MLSIIILMRSNRSFLLLIAAVIISRIPLLSGGYGSDGDAWRVAKYAMLLWNDGIYHVSRFPGFPLFEFLMTPVIALGGPAVSNAMSLIVFLLSLFLFRKIVHHFNIPNARPLVFTYAFLPILWKNSAVTMDNVWGLFGILASLSLLLKNRVLFAGIALGLAAGTRITHIVYIVPFFFMFEQEKRKEWVMFSAAAAVTASVCFLPVFWSDNYLNVVKDFFVDIGRGHVLQKTSAFLYRSVFSIGLAGWLSIAAVFLKERSRTVRIQRPKYVIVAAAMCLTGIAIFALLTDEREYLVPIMPAFLILLAHYAEQKHFVVISAALLSFSVVSVDVIDHDLSRPRFAFSLQPGYVIKEMTDRKSMNTRRMLLAQTNVPDSSVVMIGMGPVFGLENPFVKIDPEIEKTLRQDCYRSVQRKEVYYIYSLDKDQLNDFRRRGYTIYYWDEMKGYLHSFIGYDLESEHVRPFTAR